jgi:hypothetical protein
VGWITPVEQLEIKKKYHTYALYMCDYCGKPISILEMPVVDPRKGFHKWNKERTPHSCRPFHSREPKVTYHQGYCNDERLGRKHKSKEKHMAKDKKSKKGKSTKTKKLKKSVKSNPKAVKAVLALISKRENHYAKRRITKKMDKFEAGEVRDALSSLWADKVIRKKNGKYFLVKEEKSKKKSKKEASDSSDSDE